MTTVLERRGLVAFLLVLLIGVALAHPVIPARAQDGPDGDEPAETPEEPDGDEPAETPEEPDGDEPAETPEEPDGDEPTEAPEEPPEYTYPVPAPPEVAPWSLEELGVDRPLADRLATLRERLDRLNRQDDFFQEAQALLRATDRADSPLAGLLQTHGRLQVEMRGLFVDLQGALENLASARDELESLSTPAIPDAPEGRPSVGLLRAVDSRIEAIRRLVREIRTRLEAVQRRRAGVASEEAVRSRTERLAEQVRGHVGAVAELPSASEDLPESVRVLRGFERTGPLHETHRAWLRIIEGWPAIRTTTSTRWQSTLETLRTRLEGHLATLEEAREEATARRRTILVENPEIARQMQEETRAEVEAEERSLIRDTERARAAAESLRQRLPDRRREVSEAEEAQRAAPDDPEAARRLQAVKARLASLEGRIARQELIAREAERRRLRADRWTSLQEEVAELSDLARRDRAAASRRAAGLRERLVELREEAVQRRDELQERRDDTLAEVSRWHRAVGDARDRTSELEGEAASRWRAVSEYARQAADAYLEISFEYARLLDEAESFIQDIEQTTELVGEFRIEAETRITRESFIEAWEATSRFGADTWEFATVTLPDTARRAWAVATTGEPDVQLGLTRRDLGVLAVLFLLAIAGIAYVRWKGRTAALELIETARERDEARKAWEPLPPGEEEPEDEEEAVEDEEEPPAEVEGEEASDSGMRTVDGIERPAAARQEPASTDEGAVRPEGAARDEEPEAPGEEPTEEEKPEEESPDVKGPEASDSGRSMVDGVAPPPKKEAPEEKPPEGEKADEKDEERSAEGEEAGEKADEEKSPDVEAAEEQVEETAAEEAGRSEEETEDREEKAEEPEEKADEEAEDEEEEDEDEVEMEMPEDVASAVDALNRQFRFVGFYLLARVGPWLIAALALWAGASLVGQVHHWVVDGIIGLLAVGGLRLCMGVNHLLFRQRRLPAIIQFEKRSQRAVYLSIDLVLVYGTLVGVVVLMAWRHDVSKVVLKLYSSAFWLGIFGGVLLLLQQWRKDLVRYLRVERPAEQLMQMTLVAWGITVYNKLVGWIYLAILLHAGSLVALAILGYGELSWWLAQSTGWALGALALAFGFHVLLRRGKARFLTGKLEGEEDTTPLGTTVALALVILQKILVVIGYLAAFLAGAWAFGVNVGPVTRFLASDSFLSVCTRSIGVVGVIIGGFIVWRIATLTIDAILDAASKAGDVLLRRRRATLGPLAKNGVKYTLIVATGIGCLVVAGVEATGIFAGVGVLSLAVAFGAQSLVKDVLSGVFIILEDGISVGDWVVIGGTEGIVEEIGVRVTKVRLFNGAVDIVPNGEITRLTNMNRDYNMIRLEVGIHYDADQEAALQLLQEIADAYYEEYPDLCKEPPVAQGIRSLGDSAVVLRIVMKIAPMQLIKVQMDLQRRIKKVFDEEGIDIPYPCRNVYHYYGTGEAQAAPSKVEEKD